MDKCFIVTTLLLVYMIAVVDSLVSYKCEDETEDGTNPDLRLKFTSDNISDIPIKQDYFCNVITKESGIIILSNEREISYPISCSAKESGNIIRCNEREISYPIPYSDADPEWLIQWSDWTDCAMSNAKGIMYRYRYATSATGKTICCLGPCITLADRQECQRHTASSTTEEKNGKEVKKRYTLTEIILVALCCLLMGILLTALVFVLYMKRTLRECFSKHIKDVQGDSKQQSGPDMQFLTELSGVVKKYDPNNPKSADSRNENEANESMYHSLNFDQVGNDQQTYDQFNMNEPRFDRQGHQPSSSRLRQTGNDYQIDQITNLQHTNEYCRDSNIDGHNYFVLESENMSQDSRARNLGRLETHAEMDDEVKDSTLGTGDKQSDAAHEYFLLERFENGHNQD